MAVPGRKSSPDFSGSISTGSAEDFDHSCDPCSTAGQQIEAHGFCFDCKEYLCKNCFTYHQRTKASRHHQLLDRDNIDKQGIPKTHSNVCTEKCQVHKDEVIKFFCQQHKQLACHDCVSLNHRTCDLDYIPDKCADIGDSEEYKSATWLLNQKMKEVNAFAKKVTKRGKEIDTCHEGLIKDIDKFQKEIYYHIQQIRNQIQAEVNKKKSSDKKVVQGLLDTCTTISSDISKLQSSVQDNKTTKQNTQLYIAIKQTMSKLKSADVKKLEDELEQTNMQYRFEQNQDLQKKLSKQETFGKLTLSTNLVTPRKKLDSLDNKFDLNIKTKSDKVTCRIPGNAVLSSNKLVLADFNNENLKVVDTQKKLVVEEKKLDSKPYDITTLPLDQIAVTLPYKAEILIMTSGRKLSTVHTIPIKGLCRGITYHEDLLYMVCKDPTNVVILDTKGDVKNTIPLNNDTFREPCYIVVSEDSRLIYISDLLSGCIVSITLQGEISAVYKNLPGAGCMSMLDDGSLLVCSWNDGTIHHISGDLKKGRKVIDDLRNPTSICYNHHQDEVYINCDECDKLKVLSLKCQVSVK